MADGNCGCNNCGCGGAKKPVKAKAEWKGLWKGK